MLFEFQCLKGHLRDGFYHNVKDLGCETEICECGNSMSNVPSMTAKPLLYFEEGKGRWIHNLAADGNPVYVTGHEQHKRLMKENKVALAPARKGGKGSWV